MEEWVGFEGRLPKNAEWSASNLYIDALCCIECNLCNFFWGLIFAVISGQ
jgi:hypothetical protein